MLGKVVPRPSVSADGKVSLFSNNLEPCVSTLPQKVMAGPDHSQSSCLEVIQNLTKMAGFPAEVAATVGNACQKILNLSLPSQVVILLPLVSW